MEAIQYVILKKEKFNDFISRLSKMQKLVAPVSKGHNNFAYEEVTSGNQIALKYIPTILTAQRNSSCRSAKPFWNSRLARGFNAEPVVEYEPMTIFWAAYLRSCRNTVSEYGLFRTS